jgi:hypothetical protein
MPWTTLRRLLPPSPDIFGTLALIGPPGHHHHLLSSLILLPSSSLLPLSSIDILSQYLVVLP